MALSVDLPQAGDYMSWYDKLQGIWKEAVVGQLRPNPNINLGSRGHVVHSNRHLHTASLRQECLHQPHVWGPSQYGAFSDRYNGDKTEASRGSAIAQAVCPRPIRAEFIPRAVQVRTVVNKWQWDGGFSKHFGFPRQYHAINTPYSLLHISLILYNSGNCQHH
jgi:hypothetical protein